MEGGAQNTPPGVGIVDEKASGQGEAGYVLEELKENSAVARPGQEGKWQG